MFRWRFHSGLLYNCALTGNSAEGAGGGAVSSTLNHCTLTGNLASWGGGAADCVLSNCTLTANSANVGGGAVGGTLNNCALAGNSAQDLGGGAAGGTLNNCVLTSNSAGRGGGVGPTRGCGVDSCILFPATVNNCTLIGNSADFGGGAYTCFLNNCIAYHNKARGYPNYDGDSTLNYSCTTPLPTGGVGNITAEPQLASASHLGVGSPCRGAGSAAYASGLDIDGERWAEPPSIGCDEYHVGALTGLLNVAIQATHTNVATGFAVDFVAQIDGRVSASRWEYGDGTVVSNQPFASHRWASAGDYPVVLRVYNETHPEGVSAMVTVHVVGQPVHFVALDSSSPSAPYSSWATAARNIQDAVDAATVVGALVLVSNGVYQTGGQAVYGTMTNRVAVTKPVTVRSVNGPELTVIQGYQVPGMINGEGAVRCVYLTNGARLVGFALTNGATRVDGDDIREERGGGVWCESVSAVLSNCTLTGNSTAAAGGGAYGGTLFNCTLTGNSAQGSGTGGGAVSGTLNDCTLIGNSAYCGGGAADCVLNNCIVYYNTGFFDCCNYVGSILNFCCTTPQPGGLGNFTNAPLFLDMAAGNLRLQSNSPCINSGANAYAPPGLDLDGHPRIVGGTVDVGAYEFQTPSSLLSYAWLQQYGLPTDGSADYTDGDGDQFNNWQEWRAGTDPTDARSVLRLLTPVPGPSGASVSWQSVSGRIYFLERSTNLASVFQRWMNGIAGQAGTTTVTDTNVAAFDPGPVFYRVGVQE